MKIMHGNTVVADLTTTGSNTVVLQKALLPIGMNLRDHKAELNDALVTINDKVEAQVNHKIWEKLISLGYKNMPDPSTTEWLSWLNLWLKKQPSSTLQSAIELIDEITKEITIKVKEEINTAVSSHNENELNTWLSMRVMPMSRHNSKEILNNLGLDLGDDDETKSQTAIKYNAVSITDNYWVQGSNKNIKWEDIDPKRVKIANGFAILALTGDTEQMRQADSFGKHQAGPEISAIGTYPKGVFRKNNGNLYLLKTGTDHSVYAEWVASEILSCTNVYGYVPYGVDNGFGEKGFPITKVKASFCRIMTTPERDIVIAIQDANNAEKIAMKYFKKEFAQIAVIDYLIGNADRHMGNWGFFREAPTWKLTGLHNIYDNNKAFSPVSYFLDVDSDRSSIVGRGTSKAMSLKQGAILMIDHAKLKFNESINPDIFNKFEKGERYAAEFKRRCEVLGLGDPYNVK